MLADCWPRKFGGRGRDQKSCCVLRCCLVWEGQAFRQHGNQHMESWPIGSLWFVLRHVFCPRFEFFFPFKWYSFYVVVLECDGTMFPLKPCIICRLSFQGGWERHPYRFIFRGIYISPFFFFCKMYWYYKQLWNSKRNFKWYIASKSSLFSFFMPFSPFFKLPVVCCIGQYERNAAPSHNTKICW